MRLTYWYARCLDDADAYSIRERTKKAAVKAKAERHDPEAYGPVIKVTAEYTDAFDLMSLCSGEDHHHWEPYDAGDEVPFC